MDNNTDIDILLRLETWNNDLSTMALPNTVFLAFCIFVGVCGNILIFFVYILKFRGSKERYFVPYLAIADLLALCETAGFNISYNLNPVMYTNESLCKWSWFFGYLTSFVSIFLLLAIAVQRYLKICCPHGKQMTLKWRRFSLLVVFLTALIFSIPILFTYGLDNVKSDYYHVTGNACRRFTYKNRGISLGHSVLMNLAVLVVVWSLIILYSFVGRVFVTHVKRKRVKIATQMDLLNEQGKEMAKTRKSNKHRTTAMFMLISVIFIISYAPKAVIFILECVNERFWDTLPLSTRLLVRFLDTMFVLNNLANPIVYAFLDVKYTGILKNVFCKKILN